MSHTGLSEKLTENYAPTFSGFSTGNVRDIHRKKWISFPLDG